MFSKTIEYKDYDDQPQTMTVWFHLAGKAVRTDPARSEKLLSLVETVQSDFAKGQHELSESEMRNLVELIHELAHASYGLRSADGKRFKQNEEVWEAFFETSAYDKFILDLFQPDPIEAFEFIRRVMPTDAREQFEAELKQNDPEQYRQYQEILVSRNQPTPTPAIEAAPVVSESKPEAVDVKSLSREELEALLAAKS